MAIITDNRPKIESTLNGVEMTIDTSSRFVYEQYIKIYQNKYSFLREITANAFDAVIELWERDYINKISKADFLAENPIVLGVYKDASGHYISIKETKGIGMSPERMREYLKITNSTKRESEHQIGAKGIGRLSALAYQNEYYIETVYDGIKYFYMVDFYNNAPKITSTYDMPTDEPNHTKVKIYVVNFDDEKRYIEEYIDANLSYFENLVVEQLKFDYALSKYEDKGDYYLFKEGNGKSNRSNNGSYIKILLGSIPYLINFNHIRLTSKEYSLFIKVLSYQECIIKFEVSDLDVVASRDNLSMTDRTVEALKDKLLKVIADIEKLQDIVFSELWNSSPQNPNSFKLLNILFNNGNFIYENLFFDRYTKLSAFQDNLGIKRSFKDWFNNKDYNFTKFNGSGVKPYSTFVNIGDNILTLITDSNLPVKHRKNKYIIFEDKYHTHDFSELKKFIESKSSAKFIEEDKAKRALNKEDKISEKNEVYCYLYDEKVSSIVKSKEEFNDIINNNTNKVIYHALYNRETKSPVMEVSSLLMSILGDELLGNDYIIFLTTETNSNRMKGIPHINTIPLDVNKIADAYIVSAIHSDAKRFICSSSDCIKFDKVLKEVLSKHNWTNAVDAYRYYNNIKQLHSNFYTEKANLKFSIEFGISDYTPELYEVFYDCKENLHNIGLEYDFIFSNLENYLAHALDITYLGLSHYRFKDVECDVLETHKKLINLFPKSGKPMEFGFQNVKIVG
jgi:hypothetical protein